jgi:hypothetical protein
MVVTIIKVVAKPGRIFDSGLMVNWNRQKWRTIVYGRKMKQNSEKILSDWLRCYYQNLRSVLLPGSQKPKR